MRKKVYSILISISMILVAIFAILSLNSLGSINNELYFPQQVTLGEFDSENYMIAKQLKAEEDEKIRLVKIAAQKREDEIQRVITFLKKQKSPVANREIAEIIVDKSKANNADFRILIGIMGVESGFCRASFYHNCFGYLNKVKYSSYVQAFSDLVPKISRQYVAKYGWNIEAMSKAYGAVNWQHHAANIRKYASSI